MLFSIDRYFLFSGIFFLAATLMDWANDNFSFISSQSSPLAPFEYVLFIYGLFFLAIGIFYVERLRRITSKEGDLDPPPFEGTVFIGIFLTIDILLIFVTIPNYSLLTPFGRALLGSAIISLIGAPIAFLTWERQGWRRLLGLILLVAPFILIFAWLLLTALKIL